MGEARLPCGWRRWSDTEEKFPDPPTLHGNKKRTRNTVPIIGKGLTGFCAVVGFGVLGLPSDGTDIAPGATGGGVALLLFLLGQLFIGDHFLHNIVSFHIVQ